MVLKYLPRYGVVRCSSTKTSIDRSRRTTVALDICCESRAVQQEMSASPCCRWKVCLVLWPVGQSFNAGWNDLEGAATDRSTSIDPTWLEGASASACAGANMELSMLNMMDGHRVAEVEIGP